MLFLGGVFRSLVSLWMSCIIAIIIIIKCEGRRDLSQSVVGGGAEADEHKF